MPKIILIAGPPYSGKDTAGDALREELNIPSAKFSFPIKEAISAFLGMSTHILEVVKEASLINIAPIDLTYRQLLISFSEDWAKPILGQDIFGKMAVRNIENFYIDDEIYPQAVCFTDCGFTVEVECLVKTYGAENFLLLNLYRKGTDYTNDSRNRIIPPEGVLTIDVINDGSLEEFKTSVVEAVEYWMESNRENR